MSGGHFDYNQFKIGEIADEIQRLIETNDDQTYNQWGEINGRFYPKKVIDKFREAVIILKQAQVYTHEIDWYVCCDTDEEGFLRRLEEGLSSVEEENKQLKEALLNIRRSAIYRGPQWCVEIANEALHE